MSEVQWADDEPEAPSARGAHRAGFTLTFAGLFAMMLGVGAFLWGQSIPVLDLSRYVWREVAGIALGLSLPLFLLGIVHALPGRKWARGLAWLGLAVCAGGVAVFAWLYPYNWNVAGNDLSPYGIVPFGAGVVLLGAAGFMGLIDAFIESRSARHAGAAAAGVTEAPVTEEEIMRDIEEQTRRQRLSWGGVMVSDGPAITLAADSSSVIALSGAVGRRFTLDNQETDPEVDRLLAFRGKKGAAQEAQESQADALIRLRAEMREKGSVPSAFRRSWWTRFWSALFGR